MLNKFVEYAKKQGLKPTAGEIKTSGKFIEVELEAQIARNFFDNAGFYPIIRDVDKTLQVAIKELEK